MNDFDFDKLRNDLVDFYGTAACSGFPAAFIDASNMQNVSNIELLQKASENGFNLNKYKGY